MSIIFSYKSRNKLRKKRNRTNGFVRNLLFILVGCLVAYQYFYYIFPVRNDNDTEQGKIRISERKVLGSVGDKIAAKIKPEVIIPIDVKDDKGVGHISLPLLAASKPTLNGDSGNNVVNDRNGRAETSYDREKIERLVREADELINEHKIIKARELLNQYLDINILSGSGVSESLISKAIEIGEKTILSGYVYDDDPLAERYRVKTGDMLVKIAKRCKVPYKLLCRINHIKNPRKLRVGQKIKIIYGPVHGKVIMHKLMLYLYLQDAIIASYRVGLGKNNKTPAGVWLVSDKVFRPVYCDPDTGRTYAPDDPDNPTGGYWIRLRGVSGEAVGKTGFGIHGTNEPESIGRFMSKGCIRLGDGDIAEVFNMLNVGLSKIETIP